MKIEIVGVQAYVTFLSENLEKSVIVDDVPKAIVRSECVESIPCHMLLGKLATLPLIFTGVFRFILLLEAIMRIGESS